MATYPAEVWPGDASVEALDGTTDAATGLPYIAKGTGPTSAPTYEVQYNRREQRLLRELAPMNQGRVVDEGGLKVGVYPVDYTIGGQRRSFAGASGVSVPDDATTYLWLDAAAALQSGASLPASVADSLPLARVVAAGGVLTITDERPRAIFSVPHDPARFTRETADKTASYTVSAGDTGKVFTNAGASSALTFTLPTSGQNGLTYTFVVAAAQTVNLLPGTSDRILYAGAVDRKKVYASTVGHALTIVGLSTGDWAVAAVNGTWSVEA